MTPRTLMTLIALGLVALLVASSVFTVRETERAVLLRFREFQATLDPGIHFKFPIADSVRRFDGRVMTLDADSTRYFTVEQKPLQGDSFAKWRVVDPLKFYQATNGDEARAGALLQERVNTGLRNQIGRRTMYEVVSGERDQLMLELTRELDTVMKNEFGIEVVDVRVKRIDLPPETENSVFDRMRSDRQILSDQFRATGKELALGIRADAERQASVIEAEAYRDSEKLRGDGDAQSARIYAEAYNQDPEFYAFYRSLNAYQRTFRNKDDVLLLDPNSEFFRYLRTGTEPGGG